MTKQTKHNYNNILFAEVMVLNNYTYQRFSIIFYEESIHP